MRKGKKGIIETEDLVLKLIEVPSYNVKVKSFYKKISPKEFLELATIPLETFRNYCSEKGIDPDSYLIPSDGSYQLKIHEVKLSEEHDKFRWVNINNYKEVDDGTVYFKLIESYFKE